MCSVVHGVSFDLTRQNWRDREKRIIAPSLPPPRSCLAGYARLNTVTELMTPSSILRGGGGSRQKHHTTIAVVNNCQQTLRDTEQRERERGLLRPHGRTSFRHVNFTKLCCQGNERRAGCFFICFAQLTLTREAGFLSHLEKSWSSCRKQTRLCVS